jgi:hypothetical protein
MNHVLDVRHSVNIRISHLIKISQVIQSFASILETPEKMPPRHLRWTKSSSSPHSLNFFIPLSRHSPRRFAVLILAPHEIEFLREEVFLADKNEIDAIVTHKSQASSVKSSDRTKLFFALLSLCVLPQAELSVSSLNIMQILNNISWAGTLIPTTASSHSSTVTESTWL